MEDLLGFLVVIIGIVSAISSSQKKKQQGNVQPRPGVSVTRPQSAAPAGKAAPAKPVVTAAQARIPFTVAQPQVHTHLAPDCETHDAPGSLGVVTDEGKDPCHEPQLTHDRFPTDEDTYSSGLQLSWQGEDMVKAFVMQEVLTRPCQRRAR